MLFSVPSESLVHSFVFWGVFCIFVLDLGKIRYLLMESSSMTVVVLYVVIVHGTENASGSPTAPFSLGVVEISGHSRLSISCLICDLNNYSPVNCASEPSS